jgi:AraC family transcriptional regulator
MRATGFAPRRIVLGRRDLGRAAEAHELVLAHLIEKRAGYRARCGAYLYSMMTEVRCAGLAGAVGEARTPAAAAVEFFNEHLTDGVALEDVAAHCRLSPFHFARVFRRSMGVAPMAWFAQLRIARAKELLRTGLMRVKEVARRVGYRDEFYFMRVFKKHVGLTPSRFARMHVSER